MSHSDIAIQYTDLRKVHHRPLTELGDETIRVQLGGRHVERHTHTVFIGQRLGRLPQRVTAGGVPDKDAPGADATVGVRAVIHELVFQMGDGSGGGLAIHRRLGRKVPHPPTNSAADTHLDQSVDHLIEVSNCAGLQEGSGARAQHLDRGQLPRRALLGGVVHGVQRTQPLENVLDERRVVWDVPARQRLTGDVDVCVDHARRDHEPVAANRPRRCVASAQVTGLADINDRVAAHRDRSVANDVAVGIHGDDLTASNQHINSDRCSGFGHDTSSVTRRSAGDETRCREAT